MYISRGAESQKRPIKFEFASPLCIYTNYISLESLGVVQFI